MEKTLRALRVLKVDPDKSTFRQINTAFRAAMKIHHPDVPKTGDAKKFREIFDAYSHLKTLVSGDQDIPLVEKGGGNDYDLVFNKEAFKPKSKEEYETSDARLFRAQVRKYESRRFNFKEWERMHYYAPSDLHRNAEKERTDSMWRDWEKTPLNRHQSFFQRRNNNNTAAAAEKERRSSSSSSSTSSTTSTSDTKKNPTTTNDDDDENR